MLYNVHLAMYFCKYWHSILYYDLWRPDLFFMEVFALSIWSCSNFPFLYSVVFFCWCFKLRCERRAMDCSGGMNLINVVRSGQAGLFTQSVKCCIIIDCSGPQTCRICHALREKNTHNFGFTFRFVLNWIYYPKRFLVLVQDFFYFYF